VLQTVAALATIIGAIAAVAALYYAHAQLRAAKAGALRSGDKNVDGASHAGRAAVEARPATNVDWQDRCLALGPLGLCAPVVIYLQFYRTAFYTFSPWRVMLFAAAIGMAAALPAYKRNPPWVLALEFNLAWFLWRATVLVASVNHVPIVFGFDPHVYYIAVTAAGAVGNAAILIWNLHSPVPGSANPLLRTFLAGMVVGFLVQSFGVSKLSLAVQRTGAEILFAAILVNLGGPLVVLLRARRAAG
jgi:hypothetical protein